MISIRMNTLMMVGILSCIACGDNEGEAVIDLTDAAVVDAVFRIDDADLTQDAAPMILMDAGPSDADAFIPSLTNCEEICGYYERCDRIGLWVGGAEGCAEACSEIEGARGFDSFLACLQTTPCGQLQECAIPVPPPPSCDEVCEGLDACGATARLPAALSEGETCAEACAEPILEDTIISCGRPAIADEALCNESDFNACFLDERGGECAAGCARRIECGEPLDLVDCTIACLTREEPEDLVARRRLRIRDTCLRETDTCEALEQCGQASGPIVDEAVANALCEADAECGFLAEDCPPEATQLLGLISASSARCLETVFSESCADGPLACLQPRPAPTNACDEHCAVSALCGTLPEGQVEFDCVEGCYAAVNSGDPVLLADYRVGLACAYGGTCGEIAACRDMGGPILSCDALCTRRTECELQDEPACLAECEGLAETHRGWAERICTQFARGCDEAERCIPTQLPDCAPLCERLDACGLGGDNCPADCQDAYFADWAAFLENLACVAVTDRCENRSTCAEGDLEAGRACLSWCRLQGECAENDELDLVECLVECGEGLAGAEGLRLEQARACLGAAEPGAACEDLSACVENVEPANLCPDFCAEQARCQLIDDEAACTENCRASSEEAETINQLSCVLSSIRRGSGCGGIADCTGAEVEEASPLCASYCEDRFQCDANDDAFLCERQCTPDPDWLPIIHRCVELADCAEQDVCVPAAAQMAFNNCGRGCNTLASCDGGLIGEGEDAIYPSEGACYVDCSARVILAGGENGGAFSACIEQVMCDRQGAQGCVEGRPPVDCSAGWDALTACGNDLLLGLLLMTPDRAAFVALCERSAQANAVAVQEGLECLDRGAQNAAGNPLACLEQLACIGAFQ